MDSRWLGATTTEQLYAAQQTLLKEGNNVNLIRASGGNVIVSTLILFLPVWATCCGFSQRKYRFLVNKKKFFEETGLPILESDICVCDVVRRILDFVMETSCLERHPDGRCINLSRITVTHLFSGTKTVESVLYDRSMINSSASAYSFLFVNRPMNYASLLY